MSRTCCLIRRAGVGALLLLACADAQADVTVMAGMTAVGRLFPSVGVAYCYCPSRVGVEIEYLGTLGRQSDTHPPAGGVFASQSRALRLLLERAGALLAYPLVCAVLHTSFG